MVITPELKLMETSSGLMFDLHPALETSLKKLDGITFIDGPSIDRLDALGESLLRNTALLFLAVWG